MAQPTRKTPRGRVKPAPRITPTYGTARQRLARRRSEALAREEKGCAPEDRRQARLAREAAE